MALLGLGWRALQWGLDKSDPRRAIVRRIRADASPVRDVLIVTDEAPELLAAAFPLPAVYGSPSLDDLAGFRRLYVIAASDGQLGPFEARLGPAAASFAAGARRWDLDGIARVRLDLGAHLLERVNARREGGVHNGPCPRVGRVLQCRTEHEPWNFVRNEAHTMGGVAIPCIFAHPQADGRLVLEARDLPSARTLVGVVGMDDGAYYPEGAPVLNHVRFDPAGGGAPIERDIVAPSKRGTTPYRIDLGGRAGSLTFTITTRNAGARQYCFTAHLTD